MLAFHFRASEYLNHVARLIFYGGVVARSAHLRAFGVNQYSDMLAHRTCVPYYFPDAVRSGVRGVHPDHVHPCLKQLADEILITPLVAD